MSEDSLKKEASLNRAKELKQYANPFIKYKKEQNKIIESRSEKSRETKEKIMKFFNAEEKDWNNWKWQMKNRITDIQKLKEILPLDDKELKEIEEVGKHYRWAISPYYLSLIDKDNKEDPIKKISIPNILELEEGGSTDPMGEEYTNPAGSITRRYPNRLIINVTNTCANYCRHCQRRRRIGENDTITDWEKIQESIDYIKENEEITDVLITRRRSINFK